MKLLISIFIVLAIPILLVSILFFVITFLLPQRFLNINPSKEEKLFPHIASWERE